MSKLLKVSPSPHVRSSVDTSSIMYDVAIAMFPAAAYGVYQFGLKALLVIVVTVLSCLLSEYVYQSLMGKAITINDGSALVTGLILALNMPPSISLWIPFLGGVFAIIVVKQIYGGLGQNFMNPALAARCFLLISFTGQMSTFIDPATDALAGATPLALMRSGKNVDLAELVVGRISGCIGEISVIALLIGAAYLLIKQVITLRIAGTYLLTFAIFIFLFGGMNIEMTIAQLCSGGIIFGAFFMATDYVTSPITARGQILFGLLLGLLTGIFRLWGGSPEGVSYAIILGNIVAPLIERISLPKAFGKEGLTSE